MGLLRGFSCNLLHDQALYGQQQADGDRHGAFVA